MKKLGIIAVLIGGIYLVTKKPAIKKKKPTLNIINDFIANDFDDVKPPQFGNVPTKPTVKNPPVNSSFSAIPSATGAKITIEGGTLDLSEDLISYKAYDNGIVRIAKVPQFIASLEGKIFFTEFMDLFVVIDGFSYRVFATNAVERWGMIHPEDAIPVRNVPMWFKDKYPQKGMFIQDFTNPILT